MAAKRRTSVPRVPKVTAVSQVPSPGSNPLGGSQVAGSPGLAGSSEIADGAGSIDPQTGLDWPSMGSTSDAGRFTDFPQFGQIAHSGLMSYGTGYMPVGDTGAGRVFNPDTITLAEYDMMGLDPTIRACLLGYSLIMQTADLSVSCPDPDMKALIEAEFLPLLPRLMRETVPAALRFGWADAEVIWETKYNVPVEVDKARMPPPPPPAAPNPLLPPTPSAAGAGPGAGPGGAMVGMQDPYSQNPPSQGGFNPGPPQGDPNAQDPNAPAPPDAKSYKVYPYVTTIRDFVPLPNHGMTLRQTPHGELAGAVQFAYKEAFIPPSKLFHFATESLFRNPYGLAMTKPCYPLFYFTRFLYEMLMVCVERAGAPPILGRYPANARLTVGTTITGQPIMKDASEVMRAQLSKLRSFAVATFPSVFDEKGNNLYSVEELPLDAHIDWITTAIELMNREKMKAMFFPDKLIESGEVGSYALAKEHTDLFSLAVQARMNEFLDHVNGSNSQNGVLQQFVRYNDRNAPRAKITYAAPNVEAMQGLMMAVVQAITTGQALVTQNQDMVLVPNWQKLADDMGIPYSIVRRTDGMDAMGNPLQQGMSPDQQDTMAANGTLPPGGGDGMPPGGPQGGAQPPLPNDQANFPPPPQPGQQAQFSESEEPSVRDKTNLKPEELEAVTGHKTVAELHASHFGEMAGRVRGLYGSNGDYSYPGGNPGVYFSGNIYDDKGEKQIGDIYRTFNPDHTIHNNLLRLNDESAQGQGIAGKLYDAQDAHARTHGISHISLEADISTGPYAWARQGFDFGKYDRAEPLSHYKAALTGVIGDQVQNGDLTPEEGVAHSERVKGLQHTWDIANFDTGVHVPLHSLGDTPAHIGKYVMTQEPHRWSYDASKEITPTGDSPGEVQAASLHKPKS